MPQAPSLIPQASNHGVIFDMDGVLVDSYAGHLQSWQRLAEELGKPITEAQFAVTFGRTSREIIHELFKTTDADTVRRYDDRKESLYRDIIRGNVPAMPGALELVKSLHAVGFRMAVGSSGPPENVELVCGEMGLDPFFAAKITGADVTRGKPDPQVFLLAAKALDLAPRHCIVIEDAPAGIEAAHRAGMPCIGLAGSHPTEHLDQAERVVRRLNDIDADLILSLVRSGAAPI